MSDVSDVDANTRSLLERQAAASRYLHRLEHPALYVCRHCGRLPDDDGDHSCPCPYRDDECPDHPPAKPL